MFANLVTVPLVPIKNKPPAVVCPARENCIHSKRNRVQRVATTLDINACNLKQMFDLLLHSYGQILLRKLDGIHEMQFTEFLITFTELLNRAVTNNELEELKWLQSEGEKIQKIFKLLSNISFIKSDNIVWFILAHAFTLLSTVRQSPNLDALFFNIPKESLHFLIFR